MVHAGDLLGDVLWKPGTPSIKSAPNWMQARWDMDFDRFITLAQELREEIRLEAEIYGIHLDFPVDGQALLDSAHRQYFEFAVEAAMDLDSLTSVIQDHTF